MPTVYRTHKHIPSKDNIFTKHTRQLLKYIERRPLSFDGKPSPYNPPSPSFCVANASLTPRSGVLTILPFRLSNTSQKCLTHILKMIDNASVHTPSYEIDNIPPTEMNQVMTEFEKSRESQLIPPTIWSNISNSEKIGRIVSIKLHGRTIHLYLILPKSETHSRIFASSKLAESFFHTCARRIVVWLDVALQFSGKECADTLDCYLFFTDDLKTLPNKSSGNEKIHLNDGGGVGKDETITPRHANTAFTYSCIPKAKIVLFRMEEWFKVFIHESFHCFGLDFSEMNIAESNKHMSKLFPKCQFNMDFRIYETYCETWAETINVIFLAYFRVVRTPYATPRSGLVAIAEQSHLGNNKNIRINRTRKCSMKCRKEFRINGKCSCCDSSRIGYARHVTHSLSHSRILHILQQVEHMIQRERMFSMFQMSKVLAHHSLKYADFVRTPERRSSETLATQSVGVRRIIPGDGLPSKDKCSTLEISNSHADKPEYTEETQVFAYYIVKPVLLFHLNEFIEWCNTHNGHNNVLFFKKTDANVREYGDLIERLYMLPEFIKTVESEHTNYSRLSSISNAFIKDTLRMSLFEFTT